MRTLLLLLVGLLAGCTCEPSADWHGDKRFTQEERVAIERGEAWLATSAGRTPATFAWDYEVTSAEELPHTIRRERSPQGTTGLCTANRATVYLDPTDPNATPGTLDGLAAHEMGHCELGLKDDPKSVGIMHIVSPMLWTEREAAQLR